MEPWQNQWLTYIWKSGNYNVYINKYTSIIPLWRSHSPADPEFRKGGGGREIPVCVAHRARLIRVGSRAPA